MQKPILLAVFWLATITAIASESVRGEFDVQSESGQIRGQFDAKPCLNY